MPINIAPIKYRARAYPSPIKVNAGAGQIPAIPHPIPKSMILQLNLDQFDDSEVTQFFL
jgi:hypothetical protein